MCRAANGNSNRKRKELISKTRIVWISHFVSSVWCVFNSFHMLFCSFYCAAHLEWIPRIEYSVQRKWACEHVCLLNFVPISSRIFFLPTCINIMMMIVANECAAKQICWVAMSRNLITWKPILWMNGATFCDCTVSYTHTLLHNFNN